jgi:hypothetical protein
MLHYLLNMDESQIIKNKKRVSYSQFSKYSECPRHFYWDYVMGKRLYEDSLNTCFGTAIHDTLQLYIKTLYTEGSEKADAIDSTKMFKERFTELLKEKKVKHTDDEYTEFIFDGEDILSSFFNSAVRLKYFPSNKYEFIGVEVELDADVKHNVCFTGFIDLVLREKETGKIKIYDFKTSTLGWNSYQRSDPLKLAQLQLYKGVYSKKFNVPLNQIDVEFFILKRKLYEGVSYPQSRIQILEPPDRNKDIAQAINYFGQFITECFTPGGEYNTNIDLYPKVPGNNKKNCKYCSHKKVNCDAKATK